MGSWGWLVVGAWLLDVVVVVVVVVGTGLGIGHLGNLFLCFVGDFCLFRCCQCFWNGGV